MLALLGTLVYFALLTIRDKPILHGLWHLLDKPTLMEQVWFFYQQGMKLALHSTTLA
jgi:hypothetical protein